MKNVVGNPARGASFFQRDREIMKIRERLKNGNNIQIAAPRRIGKTSILYYFLDNKPDKNLYLYVDTEAVDNEQDFFKKILKEFVKMDELKKHGWFHRLFEGGGKHFKRIKTIKLFGQEIEFDEANEADYRQEVENLLLDIELEGDAKLVLLIDEFPQTIQNIVEVNQGDRKAAIHFLQSNRDLRLNPGINQKVIFIYTGSIGLNHTVAAIDGTAFINDLNSLEVEPLTRSEAKQMLAELLFGKELTIEEPDIEYFLDKVEWLIPFHIQLAMQEVLGMTAKKSPVSRATIDESFEKLIQARNNNHFEHYYSRLKRHFKNGEFNYADELLKIIAVNNTIEKGKAYDLAIKYDVQDRFNQILEVLMYDGYINNLGDKTIYRFNSPILRMWWERYICK